MDHWTYRTLADPEDGELEALGALGWEAYAVIDRMYLEQGYTHYQTIYHLKRRMTADGRPEGM